MPAAERGKKRRIDSHQPVKIEERGKTVASPNVGTRPHRTICCGFPPLWQHTCSQITGGARFKGSGLQWTGRFRSVKIEERGKTVVSSALRRCHRINMPSWLQGYPCWTCSAPLGMASTVEGGNTGKFKSNHFYFFRNTHCKWMLGQKLVQTAWQGPSNRDVAVVSACHISLLTKEGKIKYAFTYPPYNYKG